MLSIFTINIIIHIAIMAIFLTLFYFTVAVHFEKKIVKKQVDFIIDDVIGNTFKPLSTSRREYINTQIKQAINKNDLSKLDGDTVNNNNKIIKNAAIYMSILFGILLLIIILLILYFKHWKNKETLKYFLYSGLYTLLFIFIMELLFLFLIAQNYLSADPIKIKSTILKNLFNK
tara:strand:- start:1140 stop:1661 length:522 start_codon:yes stop_codon:yes gene_type:complete